VTGELLAGPVVSALSEHGQTVAVAESLTGGMLCSALIEVPGASAVVRGAVVAYATELKHRLLDVEAGLLDRNGPVDPTVAAQMALGVRERLGADWGLATTGVAGPVPQDGIEPGRVYVAVAGPLGVRDAAGPDREANRPVAELSAGAEGGLVVAADVGVGVGVGVGTRVLRLDLPGGRMAVRVASTEHAIALLLAAVAGSAVRPNPGPGPARSGAGGGGVEEHGDLERR